MNPPSNLDGAWRTWTDAGGLVWADPGQDQRARRATLDDCASTIRQRGESGSVTR